MNKHFFSLAGGNKIWPPVNPNFLLLNTGKCWSVAVWSECVHPVFCWIVNQTKCKMWPNCEKEKVALALSWLLLPGLGWRGSVLVSVAAICAARCQSPWLSVLYRNKVISAQIRQKPATITTQPGPGSLPVTVERGHRSAARDQATLFITAARSHTCPGVTLWSQCSYCPPC